MEKKYKIEITEITKSDQEGQKYPTQETIFEQTITGISEKMAIIIQNVIKAVNQL